MINSNAREHSTTITLLKSNLEDVGVALPDQITKALAKVPDLPQVPQVDVGALTQAYLTAKGDPLDDPVVKRQLALKACAEVGLQDRLQEGIIELQYSAYRDHSQALFTLFREVAQKALPVLQAAVLEYGVTNLDGPNFNAMTGPQITATVEARTANNLISNAVSGWQRVAKMSGEDVLSLDVLCDLDHFAYQQYRAKNVDAFILVLDGHKVDLPENWEAMEARYEHREQSEADALARQTKIEEAAFRSSPSTWTKVR